MAEVPGGEGGGGGGRHQKKRAKKGSTRIDMTPMVDLAFLLLTFFILTTTMYKPSTLQLTYPVPPDEQMPQPPKKVNNAITLFLTKKDQILYYKDAFKPGETQLTRTDFKDIRKTLVELNRASVDQPANTRVQRREDQRGGLRFAEEHVPEAGGCAVCDHQARSGRAIPQRDRHR